MSPFFVDSFYYIALLNPSDENHARVVAFTRGIDRSLFTTTWVLTEVETRSPTRDIDRPSFGPWMSYP